MNQLQRDIQVALSWFIFLPDKEGHYRDLEAFNRLKDYMEKDLDYETYTGGYLNDSQNTEIANLDDKELIQVYLDLKNENGCWNCKHDWSICKINNIGTVGYVKGVSHCALKDWEYKGDEE